MTIVINIVLGVIIIFIVIFIIGLISSMISSRKRFPAHAKFLLAQISEVGREVMKEIWEAHKKKDADKANAAVSSLSQEELISICALLDPNERPADLSSGKVNDNAIWLMHFNEMKERGFNDKAAAIIAGIGLNGIENLFK